MFDWTVSIGNIIQVLAFGGMVAWMFMAMRADIKIIRNEILHLESRQQSLNEAFTQLGTILRDVAVQDNRIHMLEKNIDELRHGQGFIKVN